MPSQLQNTNSEKKDLQFISCPVCEGAGESGGKFCNACGGMGLGVFFSGKFFYWGRNLTKFTINFGRLKDKINLLVNFLSFFFGLAGILAFAWWAWQNWNPNDLETFFFWRQKNIFLLLFSFSLIADLFVVYRLSEEGERRKKIKKLKWEEKKKEYELPDNWDELKIEKKYLVDVADSFSPEADKGAEEAYLIVHGLGQKEVAPIHLFLSLLEDKKIEFIFSRLGIDISVLAAKTEKQIFSLKKAKEESACFFTNEVKEIFIEAYVEAYQAGNDRAETADMIIPILRKDKNLYEIIIDLGIDLDKIANCLAWFRINEKLIKKYKIYRQMARFKPSSNMDRAYTALATPLLDRFSFDLTRDAKWGRLEFCVGREKEIEAIWEQIEGGRNGLLLVGPPGVGKNTIIHGLAELMVEENVPKILYDKRLLKIDIARLVSGASPEEAQERLLVILDEVVRARNIVLYFDNIENITGISSGEGGSLDLSEVLINALEKYNIYCFASATLENYRQFIESSPLGQAMVKIDIGEPDINKAIQIAESKVGFLEGKHKVYFFYSAIDEAVRLADKFLHEKYLPLKAIEIMEIAAARISKRKENNLISESDIREVLSEITHIPITVVGAGESAKLLNLEKLIHERMVGQEEAVDMVAASLRRARAEMREGKKPIASFLFLGPTGVGKTELAKTLASVYFGAEDIMVRVDMSEYQHPDSIKKMIGDPSAKTAGFLTEAVRRSPFSLILLDEFEKAHPDILNLFLQVMDDGRLTDGSGRTADFTNSMIIATSNAGALFIQESVRAKMPIEYIKKSLIEDFLNKAMRPELINRFDGIVVFKPLSQGDVVSIAKILLKKIGKMLDRKGINLRCEEEGIIKLAQEGFDPQFGARPLRRILQDKIENVIANKILAGELKRRDTIVINSKGEVEVEKRREI
jgi:ATP-dependent Clp protease ATP-binding subunit ClpC